MASDPDSSNESVSFKSPAASGEPRGFLAQIGHELSEAAQNPVDGVIGAAKGAAGLPWDILDLGEVIENKGRDALGWLIGRDIPHYKNEIKKPEILEPSNDAQRGGDKAVMILGVAGLAKGLAKQGIKVTKRIASATKTRKLAKSATKNADSDTVLLGKETPGSDSYDVLAQQRGETYFRIDNWDEVTQTMSRDEIWDVNKSFLDQQWSAGKDFVFSHDPSKATGAFAKEVEHLKNLGVKGFEPTSDGLWKAVK